jgi:hypothetical protein
MGAGSEQLSIAGGEQRQRPPKGGLDPHWEFIRPYSTKALLDLIRSLQDEFRARGLELTCEARAAKPQGSRT